MAYFTKKEFCFLEKVYGAEISQRQFKSNSKLAKDLIEGGYLVEHTTLDSFGGLPVHCKTLRFTLEGHMMFCSDCSEYYDDEGNPYKIRITNDKHN